MNRTWCDMKTRRRLPSEYRTQNRDNCKQGQVCVFVSYLCLFFVILMVLDKTSRVISARAVRIDLCVFPYIRWNAFICGVFTVMGHIHIYTILPLVAVLQYLVWSWSLGNGG